MKKFLKITGIIFAVIVILLLAGYGYMYVGYPKSIPVPDLKIASTPEMIKRGEYLANSFAACMDCHSQRDYTKFSGPIRQGTLGMGGEDFGEGAGFILAKNITPDKETGLGNWTDGEIFRAITSGIDKNGEPLGPMMPYAYFGKMDKEDIYSIIAYIKTIPPLKNEIPDHKFNFPLNLIFRTLPSEPDFHNLPPPEDKLGRGKYYSGSCFICHSPMEKGEFIQDKLFSGGVEFKLPEIGTVRTANISPDKESGIGKWTKEQFIERFRFYNKSENQQINVNKGEFNTVMPWIVFSNATDEDLGAVYDYLMTQKPVFNKVEKFTPEK